MRPLILKLHRWTGLTAGLVLVFVAITGILILFRPQLEPVVNAQLLTAPACPGRASVDSLTEAAVAARPQAKLDYVRMTAGAPGDARIPAVAVRFTDQTFVYLDPCSAAPLGIRHRYGGVLGTIEQLHRFRFMQNGSLITGTCALLLVFVLAGGGIWLWLPHSWRMVRRTLGLDRSPASGINLHRRFGAWAGVVLMLSALTGLPQAFEWYKELVHRVAGSTMHEAAPRASAPLNPDRPSLEALWRTAEGMVPNAREILMHYPARPGAAVDFYLIAPDAPHPNARNMLYLDPQSGAVLSFLPYERSSAGSKLYFWTLSYHMGLWGGLPAQLILLFGAASLPVLAVTGVASYLRRRRTAAGLRLKVTDIRYPAPDICEIELVRAGGGRLPRWTPGAHLDLNLGNGLVRQYSLCGDPADRSGYRICVRRVADSRGGSAWLHEELGAGQELQASRPRNHFALRDAPHVVLLAGGIGITPLIGMAEELSWSGRPFELHCCSATAESMPLYRRIKVSLLASRTSWYFSRELPASRIRFDEVLALAPAGSHVYVCGPAGFIDGALAAARRAQWDPARVHVERFQAVHAIGDKPFELELARSGRCLTVPAQVSALSVLTAAGVALPRSCEQGVCGSCVTAVLDGVPLHRDQCLSERERNSNAMFTPCCSRARSARLVLDL